MPSGVISVVVAGGSSTAAAGAALPWTGVADLDEDLLLPLVLDLALGAGDAPPNIRYFFHQLGKGLKLKNKIFSILC